MNKEEQKEAILEKQFDMAMNGSVEMLKWLGIQLCGQDNKPTKASETLPQGFDVTRIMNAYEQDVVQEYEENKEEFLVWVLSKDESHCTRDYGIKFSSLWKTLCL